MCFIAINLYSWSEKSRSRKKIFNSRVRLYVHFFSLTFCDDELRDFNARVEWFLILWIHQSKLKLILEAAEPSRSEQTSNVSQFLVKWRDESLYGARSMFSANIKYNVIEEMVYDLRKYLPVRRFFFLSSGWLRLLWSIYSYLPTRRHEMPNQQMVQIIIANVRAFHFDPCLAYATILRALAHFTRPMTDRKAHFYWKREIFTRRSRFMARR